MADETRLYNGIEALRNVANLAVLIETLTHRAQGLPGMGTFYGFSGYGKTMAAIWCSNKYNAVLVEVRATWKAKFFLGAICVELGIPVKGSAADMEDRIISALIVQNRPLIIDEADHLVKNAIVEIVRNIHDATQLPVVLLGEELLPQKLREWERVASRMRWVQALEVDSQDVERLKKVYAPSIEIAADVLDHIRQLSGGSARRVSQMLAELSEQSAVKGWSRIDLTNFKPSNLTNSAVPVPRRPRGVGAL